jgi:hypothetical protein
VRKKSRRPDLEGRSRDPWQRDIVGPGAAGPAERKVAEVEPLLIDRVRTLAALVPDMLPPSIETLPGWGCRGAGLEAGQETPHGQVR